MRQKKSPKRSLRHYKNPTRQVLKKDPAVFFIGLEKISFNSYTDKMKKTRKQESKKTKSPLPPLLKGAFRPELLAPAGNLEKMKTAFAFGADAVFAGIPNFSLRVRINDFTVESLKEAVEYAHSLDKKIYITLNIFAHNHHIKNLPEYIKTLKDLKPDGLIVSDPGVIEAIREIWPKAVIHLSTQANCTNWQAAKFWHKQGLERVILGREVSLEEVKEIRKRIPKLELETFIHGAMCMAYSGRCFLSKYYTGRSANLGDCAQVCRWKFDVDDKTGGEVFIKPDGHDTALEMVEEEHGSYMINSKDMCLIKHVPELIEAGISSFKIEGRAKSVYYLACVIGSYRKAIDIQYDKKLSDKEKKKVLNTLYKDLEEKLKHRGYTDGFMFGVGKSAQNLENSHNESDWEFCGQAISHNAQRVTRNGKTQTKYKINIKAHNTLKIGDTIEIIRPGYDIIKMKLKKMADADSGEKLEVAHGGQKKVIMIELDEKVPEYSVIRRKKK